MIFRYGLVNSVYRVLYIDSEGSLRDRWSLSFKRAQEFTVDITTSAEDALNAQSTSPYDVIISGYHMAGMDGITLLKGLLPEEMGHPADPVC